MLKCHARLGRGAGVELTGAGRAKISARQAFATYKRKLAPDLSRMARDVSSENAVTPAIRIRVTPPELTP